MTLLSSVRDRVAAAGGGGLAAAARAVAVLRAPAKPLHPRGRVVAGRLDRRGLDAATGVAFLDDPGADEVLVRLSRAVGLPGPLPDVHGMAIRVSRTDGEYGDLLFASTGRGRLTRFVLTVSRRPRGRPMTTLLPYTTPAGAVVLGARFIDDDRVEMSCAVGGGPWREFAELCLLPHDKGDPMISFDPVRNQLPGLGVPTWVVRLREPAYVRARRTRDDAAARREPPG